MELPTLHLIRLKNSTSICAAVLFISISTASLSAFSIPKQQQLIAQNIVDCIITNQYDSVFQSIDAIRRDTDDPLYMVLELVAVGLRDVDFEKTVDSAQFLRTYEKTIESIRLWEKKKGASSYSSMLTGMSMLIHASFYVRQKKYFTSMQNVFDALDQLKEAQKKDTANYEIDLFLGLYEYARAELRSRLWWILFWYPGDRQNGIKRVQRSAENAVIIDEAAKLSLCDIFIKEKQNEKAKKYLDQLKIKYPHSRFVLWAEVKYYETEKVYDSAASVYNQLAAQYELLPMGEYNCIFTYYKQAEMLSKTGRKKQAYKICTNILKNKALQNYKSLEKDITRLRNRCDVTEN